MMPVSSPPSTVTFGLLKMGLAINSSTITASRVIVTRFWISSRSGSRRLREWNRGVARKEPSREKNTCPPRPSKKPRKDKSRKSKKKRLRRRWRRRRKTPSQKQRRKRRKWKKSQRNLQWISDQKRRRTKKKRRSQRSLQWI